jgi:hypothetical protein
MYDRNVLRIADMCILKRHQFCLMFHCSHSLKTCQADAVEAAILVVSDHETIIRTHRIRSRFDKVGFDDGIAVRDARTAQLTN